MLVLNVIQGPDKGRRFELPDNEPQLIGRSSEALPVRDQTISRRHAELTPNDGQWYINDLDSANGTYVNGKPLSGPTLLHNGDQVRVGATLFVFGRVPDVRAQGVRVLSPGLMDSSVNAALPSNDESVIMAWPDPSESARHHLKVLYELMHLVGSVFEKPVLLERVMDLVFEHFEPDRGVIFLRDRREQKLPEPAVVRHRHRLTEQERRITVSRTIVQHVVEKSEAVLSSNAMADDRFSPGESIHAYGIRSAICAPLKFREQTFGAIYVDSKVVNYTFTEDQLRLMTAIGLQTGLALENAELYQEGVRRARLAAVGETVASLSHSIRNMLQAIRGGAEVLELGLRKDNLDVVKNGWDVLSRNLDRVYELTLNMLTFSKQRKPEFEMVRLEVLLEEILELMREQAQRRKVRLLSDIEADMPPIPADSSGFHQAVMNLLHNALDAVEDGRGIITVCCRYDAEQDEAVISVGDNGRGIDAETLEQLFVPFYSTKGLRGTGLGLAVTKKIIEEHGGQVRVDAEPGRGSTFTLTLSGKPGSDPAATDA